MQEALQMVPTFLIRDAMDSDMPAIQAIYAHHVTSGVASFETVPPTLEEMTRRRNDVLSKGLPYRVAEQAGQVVGYAYATPYRERVAYASTVENSVYVRNDRYGQGIGKALLKAVIKHCIAGDWRQMVAVIGDSRNEGSIALHTQAGFRRVGVFEKVGYKQGQWLDTVLMQRGLGEAGSTPPRR